MKVELIESDESKWNSFVESSTAASSYHRFEWKRIIAKTFGHHSYYLAAIDGQGQWHGVLPLIHIQSRLFGNFLISVPFVNYGGLLCSDSNLVALLLNRAEQLRKTTGASHVELRHVGYCIDGLPTRQHKVTMILNLAPDEEGQWRGFNAKLRNQIRKAEKSSLHIQIGGLELLERFYRVFARNMRDLGTPVYSQNFFRNVLETFPETSRIFAVCYGDAMIAAGIGTWFRETLEIPWASSNGDYKALCPNNMLYWEAIRFAITKGLKKLDFGRSTPHEGTYNFKKQWGAIPVQLYWQYLTQPGTALPDLSPSNPKYDFAIRLWQKLPLPVTKVLGPFIVRNIP